MSRYAAKKDVNHSAVEHVFRQLLADRVTDSSGWFGGAGDLFVSYGKFSCMIEIKRDKSATYTAAQIRFRKTHPHAVIRVEDIAQAKAACDFIRQQGGKLA